MGRQIEREDRATWARIECQVDGGATIKCSNLHDLAPGRAAGCSLRKDCKFTEGDVAMGFAGLRQKDFSPLEHTRPGNLREAGRLFMPNLLASQVPTAPPPWARPRTHRMIQVQRIDGLPAGSDLFRRDFPVVVVNMCQEVYPDTAL